MQDHSLIDKSITDHGGQVIAYSISELRSVCVGREGDSCVLRLVDQDLELRVSGRRRLVDVKEPVYASGCRKPEFVFYP